MSESTYRRPLTMNVLKSQDRGDDLYPYLRYCTPYPTGG